jgi:ATP-dependent DNA helicase RecG
MHLNSLLADELRLTDRQKKALEKLKLKTAKDLLWYFPARYEKFAEHKTVADVQEGEKASIQGEITNIKLEKTWRKKMNITRAVLNDGTGAINLVWFHQPFIANILKKGDIVTVTGKIQKNKNGLYLANPIYLMRPGLVNYESRSRLIAIYPETRGLSSQWFRFTIQKIIKKALANKKQLTDIIPQKILNRYNLPSLKNALIYVHTPREEKNAKAARKRFAFEEIFLIQLSRAQKRLDYKKQSAFVIRTKKSALDNFLKNFSFKLTNAQQRSLEHIIKDLGKESPMARFLEGDVGSGKTAVAAATAFLALENGYQTAYMAPTEILARQLFDSFTQYFINSGAQIGLITSSECRKFPSKVSPKESTHISRSRLLKWVENGETRILIGTHALIQDKVNFKNLALVIIDEQHRFGTSQRAALAKKKTGAKKMPMPHLLSMSATPIPRTLALTIYGDLDLTLLDEMPPGRKEIITEIVPVRQREIAYKKIKEEVKRGRQAYVVCPRIEPSDPPKENVLTLNMRAVKEEYEKLSKEIFPEYKLAMLYGKMPAKEKEKTMKEFEEGKINILVATSVVEVGVNVPNVTAIIIEGAERFGLAQLHQLRGRVLRSTYQPHCFIFTESKSQKTLSRLKALKTAQNGFELAEYDLQFRGPGELAGKKQWGISDVGMEALKNIKMVEAARIEAQKILQKDPELKNHPLLKEKINQENLKIEQQSNRATEQLSNKAVRNA